MNTGPPESNYGFWFPGKENDGAAGWQFMSSKYGNAWMGSSYPGGVRVPRGPWHYDGEIDLGFGGALRMATTVLTRDPIFDWFAYGGTLTSVKDSLSIIPRDGLRQRFHVVLDEPEAAARQSRYQRSADSLVRASQPTSERQADKAGRAPGESSPATGVGNSMAPRRLKMELDRDGFAAGQNIVVDRALKKISFTLENRTGDSHATGLWLALPEKSSYSVMQDGKKLALKPTGNWDHPFRAELIVTTKPASIELVQETRSSAK
jgi:hypothetical protein